MIRKLLFLLPLTLAGIGHAEKVRIGYVQVLPTALSLIAQEQGYYKDQGLDVELIPFGSGPVLMQALVGGKLDAAQVGFAPVYVWAARGAPVRVVAKAANADLSILVKSDSNIKGPGDLKNKRVGVLPPGSVPETLFSGLVLPKFGVDSKSVTIVNSEAPNLVGGLATNRFDAAVLLEPWTTIAQLQLPLREAYNINTLWKSSLGAVLAVHTSLINKQPETVKKLVAVQAKAVNFVKQQPEAAAEILARQFFPNGVKTEQGTVPGPQVVRAALKGLVYDAKITTADLKSAEEYGQLLQRLGNVDKTVPINQVVHQRFTR
ncbi:hypothetical protein GCM10010840_16230 [Deinococcus aerolatus]|uniref:NitT/TauT family transport system substrate-binding protein n=1 Tax=Deinococcus aerolatus TaxID=522487 RepID=A0ABQ2G764_9DEIO|nr:ABC transporter substrate-binding protein [Deinococcus aerolatus]GGL79132.1 hypothetical protein GCM10010840_16230 [Deinococcus aerolatus]